MKTALFRPLIILCVTGDIIKVIVCVTGIYKVRRVGKERGREEGRKREERGGEEMKIIFSKNVHFPFPFIFL